MGEHVLSKSGRSQFHALDGFKVDCLDVVYLLGLSEWSSSVSTYLMEMMVWFFNLDYEFGFVVRSVFETQVNLFRNTSYSREPHTQS